MKKKGRILTAVLLLTLIFTAWYLYPITSTGELSGRFSDEYWSLEYKVTKEMGENWIVDTRLHPKSGIPQGVWTTKYFFGYPLEDMVMSEGEGHLIIHQLDGHALPKSRRMNEEEMKVSLQQRANVMIQWTDNYGTEQETSLHFEHQEQ